MATKKYYVYYLIDPRNNQPFYVGRGQQARMYSHVREALNETYKVNTPKVKRIQEIYANGYEVQHKIIKRFSELKECQRYEIEEIKKWGRVDNGTGCLLNLKTGDEKPKKKERRVCQYNRFCELVATHESTNEAANALNIKHASSLANAIRGRIPSYKGFLWAYEGDSPRPLEKIRPVYQWSKTGQLVGRYENAFRAAEAVGVAPSQINQHMSRNRGAVKGFIFSREKTFPGWHDARRRDMP